MHTFTLAGASSTAPMTKECAVVDKTTTRQLPPTLVPEAEIARLAMSRGRRCVLVYPLLSLNRTAQLTLKQVDGTTMVDFASFFEYLSPNTPILGNLSQFRGQLENLSPEKRANSIYMDMYKTHWDRHAPGKTMSDDQYLHCPPRVLGYALKQKKWAQLLVDKLNPPNEADSSVFHNKLQLDPDYKDLVRCSVQAHEYGKNLNSIGESMSLQDFAPDKGKGLVIMLYGKRLFSFSI
jgi:hypothetical protein